MNELPVLRVAKPQDATEVSRVIAASYSTLYRGWYRDEVLDAALPKMARANPALLASGTYFVALLGTEIVACGGWSRTTPGGGETAGLGHVRHFATHPDHLGRGCGGAILRRCIREAQAVQLDALFCLSSLAGEAFYARHGFVAEGVASSVVGGVQFACIAMRLPLCAGRASGRNVDGS